MLIQKKAPFSGREGCDLDKTGEFLSFTLYDKYIKNKTLLFTHRSKNYFYI